MSRNIVNRYMTVNRNGRGAQRSKQLRLFYVACFQIGKSYAQRV